MKNRHNSLKLNLYAVLALAALSAAVLYAGSCSRHSQEYSESHGIHQTDCSRHELLVCMRAAREYLTAETGGCDFLITDNSWLGYGVFVDSVVTEPWLVSECRLHIRQSQDRPWLYDDWDRMWLKHLLDSLQAESSRQKPDTVLYRTMWFRARIDGGLGTAVREFQLFFPPGLEYWCSSEQELVARTRSGCQE